MLSVFGKTAIFRALGNIAFFPRAPVQLRWGFSVLLSSHISKRPFLRLLSHLLGVGREKHHLSFGGESVDNISVEQIYLRVLVRLKKEAGDRNGNGLTS